MNIALWLDCLNFVQAQMETVDFSFNAVDLSGVIKCVVFSFGFRPLDGVATQHMLHLTQEITLKWAVIAIPV